MTLFYIMNGDTAFDTICGIRQVSFFGTLVFSYFWIWFGNNIIINITLAQVEHGYLQQKAFNKNDWLCKAVKDPLYIDEETIEAHDRLFMPKSLYYANIYSHNVANLNKMSIAKMQQDKDGVDTWNFRNGIETYLEVENFIS